MKEKMQTNEQHKNNLIRRCFRNRLDRMRGVHAIKARTVYVKCAWIIGIKMCNEVLPKQMSKCRF